MHQKYYRKNLFVPLTHSAQRNGHLSESRGEHLMARIKIEAMHMSHFV